MWCSFKDAKLNLKKKCSKFHLYFLIPRLKYFDIIVQLHVIYHFISCNLRASQKSSDYYQPKLVSGTYEYSWVGLLLAKVVP